MTWKHLEELQKDLYGERNPMLLYTWKNLGSCYRGLGLDDKAIKCFEDSISLLQELPVDEDKETIKMQDKVELLSLK